MLAYKDEINMIIVNNYSDFFEIMIESYDIEIETFNVLELFYEISTLGIN